MTADPVERIASALLYEGYLLYPYRPSAVKNRQRFNFGVVYPHGYSAARQGAEPCITQTECVVLGDADTRVEAAVRFLHLAAPPPGPPAPAGQVAAEREVALPAAPLAQLCADSVTLRLAVPADRALHQVPLELEVNLAAEPCADGVFRLHLRIANVTPFPATAGERDRDEVLAHCLVSTHSILRVAGGEFVSLTDPPEALRALAAGCCNLGTWPVLAGEEGSRDTMLSSPIIVYDYPRIAPESPGDFFDATEIDELLSLRILTLTDAEKREMSAADERARRLLERTEAMGPEDLLRLHGVLREVRSAGEAS
jgi:hypothetical protein